ncbi:CD209 antigen-like protein C [Etheostoma spectabile]|uniref:CD209 antigen-like protein C n=1 Tax=Etheostoma spectabile TaxID=54343 RepID=UPI0013AF38ED|nr:CD209 antigen-like protein C [Etheostoma spectabile]
MQTGDLAESYNARLRLDFVFSKTITNCNLNNNISEKPITNLTALNQDLETRNQKLETRNRELETQNQELETRNQELETRNQELETERKNLKVPIQNISRAQWNIDEYCPKVQNERRCRPCQEGWRLVRSSCYLFNDVGSSDLKTWDEAREDCRARGSDLVVVRDEDEEGALSFYRWRGPWVGLRAEGGRWKWIDGRDLTERRIQGQPPTDGQCAVYVDAFSWKSVSCAERRPWICQKKSLSV